MTAPVPLRADFDAARLRRLAKTSRDPDQIRRLLALAALQGCSTLCLRGAAWAAP